MVSMFISLQAVLPVQLPLHALGPVPLEAGYFCICTRHFSSAMVDALADHIVSSTSATASEAGCCVQGQDLHLADKLAGISEPKPSTQSLSRWTSPVCSAPATSQAGESKFNGQPKFFKFFNDLGTTLERIHWTALRERKQRS